MKLTRHNGRAGKNGVYNPKHNDRNFNVENSEHIDAARVCQNVYWDCYQGFFTPKTEEEQQQMGARFEQVERAFYLNRYDILLCSLSACLCCIRKNWTE